MPFELSYSPKVAVIGAGVSGLAAAYELAPSAPVTLFEAAPRLGGHARTVLAGKRGDQPVDTGFIVFNDANYPNMTRMFRELDVPVKDSNMSFSASIGNGAVEYGLRDLKTLFAQKRNMARPQYWRMIGDILKFNKHAVAQSQDPNMSLGEMLDKMQLGDWFRRYYLLPISGAIWSSTPEQMNSFPARSLVQFFENHALLSTNNHQWKTVDGGSIEYVTRIAKSIRTNGGDIRTSAPVAGVRRHATGVQVRTHGNEWEDFDEVIFACHSDQALAMIENPSADEKRILGNLRYQSNSAVLHCDESLMPKRRQCWSSWVFLSPDDKPAPKIGMSYYMNWLQGIPEDDPLFVTLNAPTEIDESKIYDEVSFDHPIFDAAAIKAQQELHAIQGQNQSWFAGAYTRWGFHEDGYQSGMKAAQHILEKEAKAVA